MLLLCKQFSKHIVTALPLTVCSRNVTQTRFVFLSVCAEDITVQDWLLGSSLSKPSANHLPRLPISELGLWRWWFCCGATSAGAQQRWSAESWSLDLSLDLSRAGGQQWIFTLLVVTLEVLHSTSCLLSALSIYTPMAITLPGLSVNGSHQKLILTQRIFLAKPSVASPAKESAGQTQISWINQTRTSMN